MSVDRTFTDRYELADDRWTYESLDTLVAIFSDEIYVADEKDVKSAIP